MLDYRSRLDVETGLALHEPRLGPDFRRVCHQFGGLRGGVVRTLGVELKLTSVVVHVLQPLAPNRQEAVEPDAVD